MTSVGAIWFRAGFISDHRTASQLISQREAARTAPNFQVTREDPAKGKRGGVNWNIFFAISVRTP